jgi:hypothetical protein
MKYVTNQNNIKNTNKGIRLISIINLVEQLAGHVIPTESAKELVVVHNKIKTNNSNFKIFIIKKYLAIKLYLIIVIFNSKTKKHSFECFFV